MANFLIASVNVVEVVASKVLCGEWHHFATKNSAVLLVKRVTVYQWSMLQNECFDAASPQTNGMGVILGRIVTQTPPPTRNLLRTLTILLLNIDRYYTEEHCRLLYWRCAQEHRIPNTESGPPSSHKKDAWKIARAGSLTVTGEILWLPCPFPLSAGLCSSDTHVCVHGNVAVWWWSTNSHERPLENCRLYSKARTDEESSALWGDGKCARIAKPAVTCCRCNVVVTNVYLLLLEE